LLKEIAVLEGMMQPIQHLSNYQLQAVSKQIEASKAQSNWDSTILSQLNPLKKKYAT
jgi:hypothetical protein